METSELLKRVRQIEIKTRGLSSNIFAGQYHSAFKGRGMAFSEVREYQYGDDVRDIDWNVTARFDKPFVKTSHHFCLKIQTNTKTINNTVTNNKHTVLPKIFGRTVLLCCLYFPR